ncbi:allophanate hydrolase subunit 1 [Sesbania bispinosa]|nr:allophanate hydrolase subunit 1 [Sesbania bispinosa]
MSFNEYFASGKNGVLLKKVDENNQTGMKGPSMNVEAPNKEQVNARPHDTANGMEKTNWDNIKLEPFPNNDDDLYFVVGSDDDEGYFHDMSINKAKLKMPTHSSNTPHQHFTGNSFLKSENDMFYNMDKGLDLKQLASNFKRGNKDCIEEDKSSTMLPRKLSFTPSGAYKKQKMSSVEAAKKCTPRKKLPTKDNDGCGTTPKEKKCHFCSPSK